VVGEFLEWQRKKNELETLEEAMLERKEVRMKKPRMISDVAD